MLIFIFGLGAIVGSFLNVLVYRLLRGEDVVRGRSRCPFCKKNLNWFDLVPIFSFLFLRGRCRYCRRAIHWQYPLVELGSGLLFLGAYLRWRGGDPFDLVFSVFLLTVFLALGVSDARYLILPDEIIVAGGAGTLFYGLAEYFGWLGGHYGIFLPDHWWGAGLFFVVLCLVWFVSKGRWLGLGDAKLMALVGLVFGWRGAALIFYTAIVIGGIIGLVLYLSRRADLKTKLPLGTYICLAGGFYIFQGLWLADRLKFYLLFR